MVFLSADRFTEKLPGEQWSRRETVEARGTKWNFDVEMDSGIPGPLVASRPDEGMSTVTTPMEIPTEEDKNNFCDRQRELGRQDG